MSRSEDQFLLENLDGEAVCDNRHSVKEHRPQDEQPSILPSGHHGDS